MVGMGALVVGMGALVVGMGALVVGMGSARKPETDWDDEPGLTRVVIPIHFGFFWPFSARKARNRLG